MANAKIDILGQGEIELVTNLYNQIFKPARDVEFFRRRYKGRYNGLIMVASIDP